MIVLLSLLLLTIALPFILVSANTHPPRYTFHASEPKELWIIPGADHGGTFVSAGNMYGEKVGSF